VAARVGAQRYLLFANGMLEGVALDWLRQAFRLPDDMEGVFVSGGTSANIVALAAARQQAYEQVGVDPAFDGLAGAPAGTVYGSVESHHCVIKAAGALGIGRGQVRLVACDSRQRVDVQAIRAAIRSDRAEGRLPVAVVANAGSTNTGSIDPIAELADVCEEEGVWLHVDGAYGLPGILDERVADRYAGLERAQSACVDLHKWLNAPMGSGATFVRPHGLLARALTGEPAAYLEGQFVDGSVTSAWDSMGPPYHEASLELSATSRGLITWAALAEIGVSGFAERVRRHRDCAQLVHRAASDHPRLQSLVEPELSVACLRYVVDGLGDDALDELNAAILARLRIDGTHAPSGTTVHGVFTIRPCYLSAWSTEEHAAALVEAVVALGDELTSAPT
jgi:aromatic-L-amino-acid decarboxylase